jgi:hypothetical protein
MFWAAVFYTDRGRNATQRDATQRNATQRNATQRKANQSNLTFIINFLCNSFPESQAAGYYFYNLQSGIETDQVHQVRLRRDVSEDTPTTTSKESVGGVGTVSPVPAPVAPVSDVSSESGRTGSKTGSETGLASKPRGWAPPPDEVANTILKEIDIPESVVNETIKSHIKKDGLNFTSVSILSWDQRPTRSFYLHRKMQVIGLLMDPSLC